MSKKLIVSLIFVVILLLAVGGAIFYFSQMTPSAQARHTASRYMNAVRANNPQAISTIAKLPPDQQTAFFKASSLRDYRQAATTLSDGTYYFLYTFTDKKSPQKARIALKNATVVAVKTGDKLGVLPKDDGPETTATTTTSGSCLSSDDLAYIDSSELYAHTFRAMTMIFANATSLDYAGQSNGEKIISRLVDFYKKTKDKDYLINLQGYATDDPSEYVTMTSLAQNRSDKIRKTLIDQGVAADRIQVVKPTVYPADSDKNDNRRTFIDITITNLCR